MKTILSSLMALAFMLPTAPSLALNPNGLIAAFQITGDFGVTGYSLVAQCKMGTKAEKFCTRRYQDGLKTAKTVHASYHKWYPTPGSHFHKLYNQSSDTPISYVWCNASITDVCFTPLEHERRQVSFENLLKKVYDRCMSRC